MHSKRLYALAIILSTAISAFSVGRTAVLTLQFPYGAENCGMGESGVSLAENINSVFWNPASLPAIGNYQSTNYIYSHFYEQLLPIFNLKDLWHSSTVHAVFLNAVVPHIDFGAAYCNNFLNFGQNEWTDESGNVIGKANATEAVRSFAVGLQYNHMVSLGCAIKDVDSRLAPGLDSIPRDGTAQAQVLDFGIRLEKVFSIGRSFDIHPAMGFAVHSFPQDSISYFHSLDTLHGADPLPLTRWYGASIQCNFIDMLGLTYVREQEYLVVDREFIDHKGVKIQITPFFALLYGTMIDSAGSRFEHDNGTVFSINYQKTLNALIRTAEFFKLKFGEKLLEHKHRMEVYDLKPNVYLQYAGSIIHTSGENNSREEQKRSEWCFGLSLIGDIKNFTSGKKNGFDSLTDNNRSVKNTSNPMPSLSTGRDSSSAYVDTSTITPRPGNRDSKKLNDGDLDE